MNSVSKDSYQLNALSNEVFMDYLSNLLIQDRCIRDISYENRQVLLISISKILNHIDLSRILAREIINYIVRNYKEGINSRQGDKKNKYLTEMKKKTLLQMFGGNYKLKTRFVRYILANYLFEKNIIPLFRKLDEGEKGLKGNIININDLEVIIHNRLIKSIIDFVDQHAKYFMLRTILKDNTLMLKIFGTNDKALLNSMHRLSDMEEMIRNTDELIDLATLDLDNMSHLDKINRILTKNKGIIGLL